MRILELMRKLGYQYANSDGVCYGLALMGAQAVIRGEGDHYSRRIEKIHQYRSQEVEELMSFAEFREAFERLKAHGSEEYDKAAFRATRKNFLELCRRVGISGID